jgi:hypothetical protein
MVRQGPEVVARESAHELVLHGLRDAGLRGAKGERPSHFRDDPSSHGGARSNVRDILAQRNCVGGHFGGQAFNRWGLVSKIMPRKC